ncbi:MAG TPA: molybdopterin-synthase adenylyltransferase MoeB [Gemmatimonadaceae bacterium]
MNRTGVWVDPSPTHPSEGSLSPEELTRYGRHLSLPGVGLEGQVRLRQARIAVVGVGGLGTPAAQYLVAAGIGTVGLVDGDRVTLSNLQRQVLYGDADVGKPKVGVAAERLRRMNGTVDVRTHETHLDSGNALALLSQYDIVLDGTDSFPARYLINDASWLLGIPNIHGSVLRFEGRVSVFGSPDGPCYRCLYPEPPPAGTVPGCQEAGVLGVMPGLVGVMQALEAIKLVCRIGQSLTGRLLLVDAMGPRFQEVSIPRDPRCPLCGTRELRALIDYDAWCAAPAASDSVERLVPLDVSMRLQAGVQLIDVREPWEWAICRLPGAQLMPMGQLDTMRSRLDPGRETIVYCHQGVRSMDAARRLAAAGFARVAHLEGGIDRWSLEVDQTVPRY